MYSARLLSHHSVQTHTHVCIAVLTGRGFSSLSSVFISDGCTPLRPTPYATHRRLRAIKQTSQNVHIKLRMRAGTNAAACVGAFRKTASLTAQVCGTKPNRGMRKMDGWATRCVRVVSGERRPYCYECSPYCCGGSVFREAMDGVGRAAAVRSLCEVFLRLF